MRQVIAVALVAGSVALAVVIGQRMSTDAMAVVIGVVFGVAASIPTSLLVMAATRGQRDGSRAASTAQALGPDPRPPAAPQIYVVSPPTSQPGQVAAPWLQGGTPSILPPTGYGQIESSRRFKVVGEDEYWMTDQ